MRTLIDPRHILLLVGAGIVGGIMSAMVGGAALVTFPAMMATGLSPMVATAMHRGARPGHRPRGALDRAQLPPLDRFFSASSSSRRPAR